MAKNLVWFGELERKIAKLSKTTFTYRSFSYLFYVSAPPLERGMPPPRLSLVLEVGVGGEREYAKLPLL
jgi:hypothetical protein